MSDYQGSEAQAWLGCGRSIIGTAPGMVANPARRSAQWYRDRITEQTLWLLAAPAREVARGVALELAADRLAPMLRLLPSLTGMPRSAGR